MGSRRRSRLFGKLTPIAAIAAIIVIGSLTIVIFARLLSDFGGYAPDPRMNEQDLRGLTSEQVEKRFGQPLGSTSIKIDHYDHTVNQVTYFYPDKRWYCGLQYALTFEDDHLTRVAIGSK